MSMLIEVSPFKYNILTEKAKRPGVLMTLEGTFQRANTQNANKRIYPESLWRRIMSDQEINERLQSRRMVGMLDHPTSGATATNMVSHVITSHELLSSGEVKGQLEILDTPAGRIAETLFKAGVQLGISSRGDGSVEKKGDVSEVQDDFRLETYDLVLKPSTPGAYPQIIESEESNKLNNSLIADAVEGLVKSTDDIEVLLECHKIISVLEASPRCQTILSELKSKFYNKSDKVDNLEVLKETVNMSGTNVSQVSPGLTPEVTAFLKEQIDRGIAEAVREKDQQISDLINSKEEYSSRLDESIKYSAYLQEKLDNQTSNEQSETNQEQDSVEEDAVEEADLQVRYDAAVKLLDEAVKRLRMLGETQRRLDASNALLATSINRHKQEAVEKKVDSLTGDLDEAVQEKLRPFLTVCENASQVQTRFNELSSLVKLSMNKNVSKEPLPTKENRQEATKTNLNESVSNNNSNFVTSRLLQRISGVVA